VGQPEELPAQGRAAGLRKTRCRGVERTQACAQMVAATYNLLRLAKLGLEALAQAPPPAEVGA
jgi:hypothetical protein